MRHTPWLRIERTAAILLGVALGAATWTAAGTARADEEDGFKPIFNGQNLDGWDGNPKFWSFKDGAIVGQTTKENPTDGNTFCIWRQGPIDDFVLRLAFKINGGNSGVQYRSQEPDKWRVGGYQADFDGGGGWAGTLYEERGRGVLAARGQKVTVGADGKKQEEKLPNADELGKVFKPGEWNEYEITAAGNHLVQKMNGQVMCDVTDDDVSHRAMSGILALQLHAGDPMTVEFKNIRLKRLPLAGNRKKIVMVAGTPSHGPGDHEFNAGTLVLKKCLDKLPEVQAAAYLNGWPGDPTAFDNADSIMLYMDGGGGHPVIQRNRLTEIDQLMKKGVGLVCAHYAVEVPKEKGGPDLLKWIGGFYETGYSINPHWDAEFKEIAKHPVTRGVQPFTIRDEWYYNIRFPEGQSGIVPLLIAVPPDGTRGTQAAKDFPGRSEVVAWAIDRPDGGRGFGFTGGHVHRNWGNDNFRKLVLNALLWTAKAEVPADGAASSVSEDDLKANLDKK